MIANVLRKRVGRLIALFGIPLIAAGAAVVLTGAPAQAAFVNQGTFLLSSGNRCLEVFADNRGSNVPLVTNFCDRSYNQLFKIYHANDPQGRVYYQVQPYDGEWPLNRCVDLTGGTPVFQVVSNGCSGGSGQRLDLNPAVTGPQKIRKQGTNLCIGIQISELGEAANQLNCDNSITPPVLTLVLVHS